MMKKNVVTIGFLSLALLMGGTTFTSCSNDDEQSVTYPIEKDLAGTYLGDLKINVGDTTKPVPANKVEITKGTTNNTITLSLKGFTFASFSGDISLPDLPLTDAGNGTYSFSGKSSVDFASFKNLPVEAKNGKIGNGNVSVDLVISVPLVGDVTVNYTGKKLTGNESSDATIKSFTFNSDLVSTPIINNDEGTITFSVSPDATAEGLKSLEPVIVLNSDKASITPSGAQDFSNNNVVTYTVIAEDGTQKVYKVAAEGIASVYSFDSWVAGVEGQEPDMTFYVPTGWSSSNGGAQLLKSMSLADSYVVTEDKEDAHSGSAAKIQTIDSKGRDVVIAKIPKVTTGSLFLGDFIVNMSNTLKSTKFGIPYKYTDKYPVQLKGYYKYQAGKDYYTCKAPYLSNCNNATVDASQKDKGNITVVLYETPEYKTDRSDCLTGAEGDDNIKTSSRIVAYGTMDVEDQASWKEFTLDIKFKDGKSFDATKKYRLAINCSSSYQGDKFWGAPGSTLWVDDFELIYNDVK